MLAIGENGIFVQVSMNTKANNMFMDLAWDTVFQLGIFLRALRPARTVLRPVRLSSALPKLFKKKKKKRKKKEIVYQSARPQNCAQTSFHSRPGL